MAGLVRDFHADRFCRAGSRAITHAARFDANPSRSPCVPDFKPRHIVERYKALADIERGFRVLKGDIGIAQVRHCLPDRIRAHGLICFLALLLHRVMRQRLKQSQSPYTPTSALRLLSRIQRHRATIGDRSYAGLSKPTAEQLGLFEALKLQAP